MPRYQLDFLFGRGDKGRRGGSRGIIHFGVVFLGRHRHHERGAREARGEAGEDGGGYTLAVEDRRKGFAIISLAIVSGFGIFRIFCLRSGRFVCPGITAFALKRRQAQCFRFLLTFWVVRMHEGAGRGRNMKREMKTRVGMSLRMMMSLEMRNGLEMRIMDSRRGCRPHGLAEVVSSFCYFFVPYSVA